MAITLEMWRTMIKMMIDLDYLTNLEFLGQQADEDDKMTEIFVNKCNKWNLDFESNKKHMQIC